ncbi:MAG TPA: formyltransferase family protein [Longimicrobium sp.]
MRIVVATNAYDTFGGVFAQAYREAGGPEPELVVVLPPRPELGFRTPAERALAAWKLVGPRGLARMAAARRLGRPLTRRDRAYGLQREWLSSLAEGGARVVEVPKLGDAQGMELLRGAAPDLLLSLGAPVIFPARVLEVPRLGAVNVHNGRLPQYRGHFATFWEVARGERVSCTSIHVMTPKVDAGEVLAVEGCAVAGCASFMDLMLEKKRSGGRLLAEVVRQVERTGALAPLPGRVPPPSTAPSGYFEFPRLADLRAFSWPAAGAVAKGDPAHHPG